MAKPLTSDEIKRKKATQARVAQTTGALGLTSLGAFTAGRLAGTGKHALKAQKVVPALRRVNQKKADSVALGTSTAAGGIGGVGSFNFAGYTKAEAEKGKRVKKNVDTTFEPDGLFGEVGIAKNFDEEIAKAGMPNLKMPKPKMPQAAKPTVRAAGAGFQRGLKAEGPPKLGNKAYQGGFRAGQGASAVGGFARQNAGVLKPVAAGGAAGAGAGMALNRNKNVNKAYNPEDSRMKRAQNYQNAASAAGGMAIGGAAHQTGKTVKEVRDLKSKGRKSVPFSTLKTGGRAAGLAAAGAGSIYGAKKIGEKKKHSWQPYVAKSAESAFGVVHD